ncbi:MAG: hypothetical protein QM831_13005 [Kofleriaceae bacterium]
MKWLCLVLAACGSTPAPALSNAVPATKAPQTPAEKFIADGLGPELFGPDLAYARANPAGEVAACTNKREADGAFTTWCAIEIADEPFANLDSLAVMQPEMARAMNRGQDISPMTRQQLADDLRRVHVHLEPSSRAFTPVCDAAGPLSCKVLGATAAVDANGHVSLSFSGEIQGEVQLCNDFDKPVHPTHATVLVESVSRRVLVVATAPQCDNAGFVMLVP